MLNQKPVNLNLAKTIKNYIGVRVNKFCLYLPMTLEEKVLWEKATLLAEDNLEARKLFEKLKTNKMQLKGKRVLLNKPEVKESPFELSEADKLAIEMDMRKTWTKLEVYAIGDEVESVKVGDKVYMGITGLQASEAVELEDGVKLMVAERDIAIIW